MEQQLVENKEKVNNISVVDLILLTTSKADLSPVEGTLFDIYRRYVRVSINVKGWGSGYCSFWWMKKNCDWTKLFFSGSQEVMAVFLQETHLN